MKLIIVRHGDPDYENDALTEIGWLEAKSVAKRIKKLDRECGGIKSIYVSPLGRAKETASCSLELLERSDAVTCDWLKEFPPRIFKPDVPSQKTIVWDWLPADWTSEKIFYDSKEWINHPAMQNGDTSVEYNYVCSEFDKLMEFHGYKICDKSDGHYYNVVNANSDTIVFFCHFGLESVLLSRLLNCSPMILWHNFCAVASSVTTIVSEERRKGVASFRVIGYGDTSHLYMDGIKPSFSARFCECYDDFSERHD